MSDIEWTDASWNCVTGCTRVSDGCTRCYAERLSATRLAQSPKYVGVAEMRGAEARWTGLVRCHPEVLEHPLRWRKPRMIFVNSMSDTFHEDVPESFLFKMFAVMAACPQHTFQVLTKRPRRMAELLRVWGEAEAGDRQYGFDNEVFELGFEPDCSPYWPLPNVWVGTSVEDQQRADERIPHLLKVPAVVRFLSCEPLLGPLDFDDGPMFPEESTMGPWNELELGQIHWLIVGGESGRDHRPMRLEWAEGIVRQCRDAGVPCFVKQLGASWFQDLSHPGHSIRVYPKKSPKGGDMSEWPAALRVREWPEGVVV